mmetsp:Transcript_14797/g.21891  ORF Transcript_14797/g.21891 Transcript_14797/m.21891 type:complete len:426 (-) Transcript_14797:484-1761(-)
MAFAANQQQNETYIFNDMMKQDDRKDFILAMLDEIKVHEDRDHWTLMKRVDVPSSKRVNGKVKTIVSIWSFKRKQFPSGQLMKHKAHLCTHGDMQRWGVDFWETYSPVVNWITVRTLLAIASIHNLPSKCIDFVLAFSQAKLDIDIFMELPIGIDSHEGNSKEYVLSLNQSIYGLKQSSLNWYNLLSQALKKKGRNFVSSQTDPCLFVRHNCILLIYVDDVLIIGKNIMAIESVITSLKHGEEDFEFTDQGTVETYLRVEIIRSSDPNDSSFELRQPFLIRRLVDIIGLTPDVKRRENPAWLPLLHKDSDGPGCKQSWHYHSAVCLMSYLQGSSCPGIFMPVHQCARFCNYPKLSHEIAVRRIAKYLSVTSNRGLVYKPNALLTIQQCYVDADFACSWSKADADNLENVMSRTGFTIMYAGCPVL